MDFEDRVAAPEAIEASHESGADQEHDKEEATPTADTKGDTDGGLHDLRATAMKGTQHRTANLALGTQVGADGKPTGAPKAQVEPKTADAAHVSVVATESKPVELGVGLAPTEDQLFTRVPKGGHAVTQRSGSPASPNVEPTMLEHNLYIGGGPDVADVRQGGIGDCYFESCLLGVTQNDPAKISSVMAFAGNNVSVTLQKFDAKTGTHKPVTINSSTSLLTKKNKAGHVSLVGSKMRIGDAPVKTAWWSQVKGKTVEVHRRDVYETALWAPMMEKAYADFAQSHGPEGRGKDKAQKKLGSGYKIINAGGSVENCYQLFYGDAAHADTEDVHFTPGSNIITDNIPALQRLLTYNATQGNTGAGTTQGFMHARISEDGAVTRGDALVDQVRLLLFGQQVGDDIGGALYPRSIMEEIAALLRKIDRAQLSNALQTLQTTLKGFLAKTAKSSAVAKATEPVIKPDVFPHLWDNAMPAPFKQLRENLGILVNLGDDSSNKQRQNYAAHAYQVRGIDLHDSGGNPLPLVAADLPAKAASIDAEKSQVMMHNPHATNEPDLKSTGPADGIDDGKFTYTLDQFLRSFDLLRLADVSH